MEEPPNIALAPRPTDQKTGPSAAHGPVQGHQIRGLFAAWAGWALDGMDSFIYALVMVPALRELLPRSGHTADIGSVGYYGGVLFALFLVGWGLAFLWGPLADRFGRVPTLMLTILWYSVFTLAGAASTRVWHLALFRLLAGIGIGGEWAIGGTYVAEAWPENRRVTAGAWMHTGYYFGVLLAGVLNSLVGARYGWRSMFVVGGAPAVLVALVRYGVVEPSRWRKKSAARARSSLWQPCAALFSPALRRRTILNSIYMLVSISGLWAGSVYVPSAVSTLAGAAHDTAQVAAQLASRATILLSAATILGCLAAPFLSNRLGRRGALATYFFLMLASISLAFGYIYYRPDGIRWFGYAVFALGLGGANFGVYTIWLPEQYPTACRASAFAFATSFARFAGAGITFLVGAGISRFGTLGYPVALTALAFIPGILLLPFGVETRGAPLPD